MKDHPALPMSKILMKPLVSQGHVVPVGLPTVSHFKVLVISQVDQDIHIDHEGPSRLTHDDSLLPDPVSPDSPKSMMMGEDLDEAYGQSRLRRSGRTAHSKSFRNINYIRIII
jgi:hypothetical protein